MKKYITRTICSALMLALLLCTQNACGFVVFNDASESTSADTTAPTPETTEPIIPVPVIPSPSEAARERIASLYDKDLGGTPVIIATVNESVTSPMSDSEEPSVAARIDVRSAVEEKYGTAVISVSADADTIYNDALTAYNSDMYYADLLAIPQSMLGKFYVSGILANMNSLPHTDYSAPYYDQSVITASTVGSGIYAVSGAFNFDPYTLGCIYFNQTIAAQYGVGDIYSLVESGGWTWDKLGELSKSVDTEDSTVWGHSSSLDSVGYVDLAATACALNYTNNDFGSVPMVNFLENDSVARAKSAVEIFRTLLSDAGAYLKEKTGDEARSAFLNGDVLFHTDSLEFAKSAANVNIEWGILPLPKLDGKQEGYRAPRLSDAVVFSAIKNTPNYEASGLILEAMNAAAYNYVPSAAKSEVIDFCLRDNGSVKMLDYICNGSATDFAHLFASGANKLADATYGAVSKAVGSRYNVDIYIKNNMNSANRALVSMVKKYQ